MSDGFAHLGDGRLWYERPGGGFPWREEPPAATDRLDELRAAALVIVGEEDIAEVGEIADLVAAQVPGASKRVVTETDQLVNVGKPDRFNRLALDFLAFAG
jgi:pimeloyl-ACP methyl ester carboxylesterase